MNGGSQQLRMFRRAIRDGVSFNEAIERAGMTAAEARGEAKSRGYDSAAIRECIKLRAIDRQEREEKAAIVQLYGEQLGLF